MLDAHAAGCVLDPNAQHQRFRRFVEIARGYAEQRIGGSRRWPHAILANFPGHQGADSDDSEIAKLVGHAISMDEVSGPQDADCQAALFGGIGQTRGHRAIPHELGGDEAVDSGRVASGRMRRKNALQVFLVSNCRINRFCDTETILWGYCVPAFFCQPFHQRAVEIDRDERQTMQSCEVQDGHIELRVEAPGGVPVGAGNELGLGQFTGDPGVECGLRLARQHLQSDNQIGSVRLQGREGVHLPAMVFHPVVRLAEEHDLGLGQILEQPIHGDPVTLRSAPFAGGGARSGEGCRFGRIRQGRAQRYRECDDHGCGRERDKGDARRSAHKGPPSSAPETSGARWLGAQGHGGQVMERLPGR
jgi:hypothetical protein